MLADTGMGVVQAVKGFHFATLTAAGRSQQPKMEKMCAKTIPLRCMHNPTPLTRRLLSSLYRFMRATDRAGAKNRATASQTTGATILDFGFHACLIKH